MKPLAAVREYRYWSERLVKTLWDENVSHLPPEITLSHFGIEVKPRVPPKTRAARANTVEALLADHIVTDLDYTGPLSYLAGRSQMVLSSLRDYNYHDTGVVTLFADLWSGQGRRIAVCLFGSASNVCGYDPTVPEWRQFGWIPSTDTGVQYLLNAAVNAESSKDPQLCWRQAADEYGANVAEICSAALYICHKQGERYFDPTPWHRGYTIGHYQDVEWLAHIYFTYGNNQGEDYIQQPDYGEGYQLFDVVHVGAAFWVRSGSAHAWVPYNTKNIQQLDEAERRSRRRSLARVSHERRGQGLVHKPYPELSNPA